MENYPEDQAMPSSSWFCGAKDDMSLLESGLLGKYYGEKIMEAEDCYYSFQSKLGKFSDPRLLALVEFFRELYFRRRELFRKIFPQLQDQFLDLLKKSGMRLWRVKSGNNRTRFATMQRSLSLGSPGRSTVLREVDSRNEWIKVRAIEASRGTGSGFGCDVKEVESPLTNEWIKVRTLNFGDSDQQGGSAGQGTGATSK